MSPAKEIHSDWVFSFAELFGGNQAVDRVRGQQMPRIGPTLDYLGAYIGRHLLSSLICVS